MTVLFYPPDPTVLLMSVTDENNNTGFELTPSLPLHIYLSTADAANNATISVNPEGQVSF